MGWTLLYLFVFLKIPILFACGIVWWAVKQGTDTDDASAPQRRRHADPRRARTRAAPAARARRAAAARTPPARAWPRRRGSAP